MTKQRYKPREQRNSKTMICKCGKPFVGYHATRCPECRERDHNEAAKRRYAMLHKISVT